MRNILTAAAHVLRASAIIPGEQLIAGDLSLGFYGEIPAANMITGDALASAAGLVAGVSRNNDINWLKFAYNNKTLYVAKKVVRTTLSWDDLNARGIVFGNTTVVIGEKTYKVRILTGHAGFEFDKLFERVHQAGTVLPKFADYPAVDLDLGSGSLYTLCQEVATHPDWRVGRHDIPSSVTTIPKYTVAGYNGWRPVLELVE